MPTPSATPTPSAQANSDTPWQILLQHYLPEAVEFFIPETAELVDWDREPELLTREFKRLFPEAKTGRQQADQLARVFLKRGKSRLRALRIHIHVEGHGVPDRSLAERMFFCFTRFYITYFQPVLTVAILCDHQPDWRPDLFGYSNFGTSLKYRFITVKLLDYQDRQAELDASCNPFAMVAKAYLALHATQRDPAHRKAEKLKLVQQLYASHYSQEQRLDLFRFIDWFLALPKSLEATFWHELKAYEAQNHQCLTQAGRINYACGK